MGIGFDGLGTDEALRTLDLINTGDGSLDMVMQLKSRRSGEIIGESERDFGDNKPRLDIMGYYLGAANPTDQSTGQAMGRRQYSAMRVLRASDAATASIMSMFATNDDGITVEVSVFKAGGDARAKDTQPVLRIKLEMVRVKTFTLLAGPAAQGQMEIIEFAFRKIQVESAPQQNIGKRGAVRSFSDDLGGQA